MGGEEGEIAGRKRLVERRRSGECGTNGSWGVVGAVVVIGFHNGFFLEISRKRGFEDLRDEGMLVRVFDFPRVGCCRVNATLARLSRLH